MAHHHRPIFHVVKQRLKTHRWAEEIPPTGAAGEAPGTLVVETAEPPHIALIDFDAEVLVEKDIDAVDGCIPYLEDDRPSITWLDVRGIGHGPTFVRLGEVFKIHPLALEDVVNVPQRAKSEAFPEQHLIIARMVKLSKHGPHHVETEQLGILFGKGYVVTVQEEASGDVLDPVRQRLRAGRGVVRTMGADYLAYSMLDAVIDGFFPVLEVVGERLEDIEEDILAGKRRMGRRIFGIKRELLTIRRALWPQRELLSALLREGSPHLGPELRPYLRDTYEHAVQVMDMVETYREIASGLMDLYLSGVSQRLNEVMKVLTVLSSIFLPITFIAGVYGMNFEHMPELKWSYGYPLALALMALSVVGLLVYYWRKGWLSAAD